MRIICIRARNRAYILGMRLDQLSKGTRAVVVQVSAADPQHRGRYTARGFVPGACVRMVRSGDPVVVALDSSEWALSRSEAAAIHVTCAGI